MKNSEIRKLEMQLVLVGGLFAFCIATSVVIINNQPFFEKYLLEKYKPLPANLTSLAQTMEETGKVPDAFGQLTQQQQLAFYERWMSLPEIEKKSPKILVSAAPSLYITRVEQSLVCGSPEQRRRALQFIELAFSQSRNDGATNSLQALSMLDRFDGWAKRRGMSAVRSELHETIAALKQGSQ